MKTRIFLKIKTSILLTVLIFTSLLVACSSTNITSGDILDVKKLPKPHTIWVYSFYPAPMDMQLNEKEIGVNNSKVNHLTDKEDNLAVILGNAIAVKLVDDIKEMGLKAEVADQNSDFQKDDLIIKGLIYTAHEGNAAGRIFVGMGVGSSVLDTYVTGYQYTGKELKKLDSANILADGGKLPGGAATGIPLFILLRNPLALIIGPAIKSVQELTGGPTIKGRADDTAEKIAEVLKEKFTNAGWIVSSN